MAVVYSAIASPGMSYDLQPTERAMRRVHGSVANKSHRSRFVRGTIGAIEPIRLRSNPMPVNITIYLPNSGQWAVIRSAIYPAYYALGWRLIPKVISSPGQG